MAPFAQALEDLLLAHQAMVDVLPDLGHGLGHERAVARQQQVDVQRQELLQGRHVVGHVAFPGRHHRRAPAEDVIARKENLLLPFVEAAMAGLVPGREHYLKLSAVIGDAVALVVGEVLAAQMARAHP